MSIVCRLLGHKWLDADGRANRIGNDRACFRCGSIIKSSVWADDPQPRYISKGRRLTPYEMEVVLGLVEEAIEVAHIGLKIARFGAGDTHPTTGRVNTTHLSEEIGHFMHMQTRARIVGFVDADMVRAGAIAKRERFEKYRQDKPE